MHNVKIFEDSHTIHFETWASTREATPPETVFLLKSSTCLALLCDETASDLSPPHNNTPHSVSIFYSIDIGVPCCAVLGEPLYCLTHRMRERDIHYIIASIFKLFSRATSMGFRDKSYNLNCHSFYEAWPLTGTTCVAAAYVTNIGHGRAHKIKRMLYL